MKAGLYHEKHFLKGNPYRCFLNVILVERDARGVAFRKGTGRIHKDVLDDVEWARKILVLG
jgi:hypothetical protein